jgi:hypothetical protein
VLRIETNRDTAPKETDAMDSFPANMVVEPTERKPVTADSTITGRSIKVLRFAYIASAFLWHQERQFAFSATDAKYSSNE